MQAAFETIAHVRVLLAVLTAGGKRADLAAARLATLGDPTALPRPWDPGTCPPDLQHDLWERIDHVVTWRHNTTHAWRPERLIPTLLAPPPHLTHELPVLATARWQAGLTHTHDVLDDWHRWAPPTFHDRLRTHIPPTTCTPGRHTPWPVQTRQAARGL